MPVDLAACFSHDTRKALHMFGAWPVGSPLGLGKYGLLDGDLFTPLGDIADLLGTSVSPIPLGPKLQFSFKSAGVAEGKLSAKASTPGGAAAGSAKLATKLTFKDAGSAFFRTKDAVFHAAGNLGTINDAIMAAFATGKWHGDWALVHGMYVAGGTTIIISSESGGSIELEGTAKANGMLDLADASANIEGKNSDKIHFDLIAKPGLTPLICLSKIRPRNRLLGLLGWSEKTMRPLLSTTVPGDTATESHNYLNKLNSEVSMELAEELKMPPSDLFHVAELDGRLSEEE
jgi:hypothetical protein